MTFTAREIDLILEALARDADRREKTAEWAAKQRRIEPGRATYWAETEQTACLEMREIDALRQRLGAVD